MKQLTRNEIINVMEEAVFKSTYITIYENILQALEQAGVLMLVEDEPREGDLMEFKLSHIASGAIATHYEKFAGDYDTLDFGYFEIERSTIIQRNNTPVYQCKKEVTND